MLKRGLKEASIVNDKRIKWFFLISFIMITNSLLFGYLFKIIGFQYWRQSIWLIGIIIFYSIINKSPVNRLKFKTLSKYLKVSIVILIIFALKTILIDNFNIVRTINGAINNIIGFPFLCMICVFSYSTQRMKLFKFFSLFGLFISIGLIIDSFFPVSSFLRIDESMVARSVDRVVFLTENSTTLGIFFNFLMICTFYQLYISKTKIVKSF